MRAVEIGAPGGPEVLRVVERPIPTAGPGEVRVRVRAAGVNRPDLLQRQGGYPPPPGASDIPGLEIAGTIDEVGPPAANDPARWRAGDDVCALLSGGGYAEYAVVPAVQCLPIPAGFSFVTAAAVPETYFTVWTNLFGAGRLGRGESVLVHGGSSGIGTTAIQLARAFGAVPFATAGSAEKCAVCERLGARRAVNYREADFVPLLLEDTAGRGIDVILDIVGGEYLERNVRLLAPRGRLIQIGLLGGGRGTLDLGLVMRRRLTLTGSTLRSRSVEEKGALAREVEREIWPLLEAETVAPLISATLPLEAAAEAHRLLEEGAVAGKIVLTVE